MASDVELNWYGNEKIADINTGTIKALIRASNLVQGDAKIYSPVDTGNLRGSIVKAVDKNSLIATVSTNIEYAHYVEFGLRSNPNYPKQPFMRPALNNNISKIESIFISEERKAVDK